MPVQALLLIIVAAVAHSVWNLLAKRAAKHNNFIWFASALEAALFLPAAAWAIWVSWDRLGSRAAVFLLATGLLHLLYTDSLLRGYRAGDYSLVYPVARGTGPLLSFVGALVFLGERPSLTAFAGVLLVVLGILLLSGFAAAGALSWPALFWGVATGVIIAGYTLVDAYSVKVLLLSPILVEYAGNFVRLILLSGSTLRKRPSLAAEWRLCWKEAAGVAVLTPAAYILVLIAMRIAPVSHVAPAREMSMMMGAYLGARLLSEPHFARRLTASALIAAGVAALAVG
ncbi:MAG TPA: EamA family transporter [Bryobacteraceae bacterium]|nr:EamA family transporter [Bryobacteraceae bacterium]